MTFTVEQAVNVIGALDLTDEELAKVATTVLHNRGFAVKVWGEDDVRQRLVSRGDCVNSRLVIQHVMQGEDWPTMEEETSLDDGNIHAIIEGTKGDHPEWFKA